MHVRRATARIVVAVVAAGTLAACTGGPGTVSAADTAAVVSIGIGEPTHLIPTNTTDRPQKSMLSPLANGVFVSGTYANHPPSGGAPTRKLE